MDRSTDVTELTAVELATAIKAKRISPIEALDACLERVDAVNGAVNAIIWRNDDEGRRAAREATELVSHRRPDELPPFHGVPLPIKDLTAVAGWPVTYGSAAAPEGPSEASDLVVDAFVRAGFVLTGRTNTPEFGPITVAENDRYGVSRNPWDLDRTPGGSSGGAAAATAARMFPLAHANDGGGSIRIPASCCGLVGLKVSRGRVPSAVTAWEGGAVEGVVTRDVADTAAVLDVISGPDRRCWYNAPAPARPFAREVGTDPGRLRFGVVEEAPLGLPIDAVCIDVVRSTATALEALGHNRVAASVELPDATVEAFLNIVNSGLADYEGIDWARTEPHIQAGRATAAGIDSLTYVRSVHQLQRYTREVVTRWGQEFDILLTPTMTIEPPRAGDVLARVHAEPDGPALPVLQMAILASAFNVTGLPAISLPTGRTPTGLPIGVQLVGGPWDEATVIRVASQLETAQPWTARRPAL